MDDLEMEERVKELSALQLHQDTIRLENTMLSEHLSRVVTRKASLQLHLEKLEEEQFEKDEADAASRKSTATTVRSQDSISTARSTVRFSSPAKSAVSSEVAVPMSMEEKCEIAEDECGVLENNIERIRAENERVLDDLRAVINQAKMCMGEVRKEKCDFARDVLLLAQLNSSNKPYSEDILRFADEKLRRKRAIRDSIKNSNIKMFADMTALERQFASKKDLKDILHAVDFDQLKILNHQLNTRIRDRTHEVHRLKAVMKDTTEVLDSTQKELEDGFQQGILVKQNLKDRKPVIQGTKEHIAMERNLKRKLHEALLIALQDEDGPAQPCVTDYMKTQDKALSLRKEIHSWLTKVEIAELSCHELEKTLHCVRKEIATRQ